MLSLALLLFLVMDPFGNLVPVNTLLADYPPRQRRLILLREAAIATVILLIATFAGSALLGTLGLEEHALQLAGGIILFLIALGMVFPSRRILDETGPDPPLIVPIAMPFIAGPSAISMAILFSEKHPVAMVATAVLLASLAGALLLTASPTLFSLLGRRGAKALESLVGMILIILSVQMILDGIDAYLHSRA